MLKTLIYILMHASFSLGQLSGNILHIWQQWTFSWNGNISFSKTQSEHT